MHFPTATRTGLLGGISPQSGFNLSVFEVVQGSFRQCSNFIPGRSKFGWHPMLCIGETSEENAVNGSRVSEGLGEEVVC